MLCFEILGGGDSRFEVRRRKKKSVLKMTSEFSSEKDFPTQSPVLLVVPSPVRLEEKVPWIHGSVQWLVHYLLN